VRPAAGPDPGPRRDAWTAGALVLLGLALDLGWRQGLHLWGALGTDAPVWGLSAEGVLHGAPSPVPPLWPALVVLLRHAGLSLPTAGLCLSLATGALLPAAVFLAARAAGAGRGLALGAGLLCLASPDLAAWSAELQANGLAALAVVAATGLWARTLARQARWSAADPPVSGAAVVGPAAAVLTGLLPLVRESGLVFALGAILLAPLALRRGWRLSLLILGTWWLAPLLVGAPVGLSPLDVPWAARTGTALADLATGRGALPGYVAEIAPPQRAAYIAWLRAGDLPHLALWHARRSLGLAPDGWAIAAAAALGMVLGIRRRPALGAALLPLASLGPSLLLWTQRRHVLLLLPALLALAAAGLRALPSPRAAPGPQPSRVLSQVLRQVLRQVLPRVLALLLVLGALRPWPGLWRLRAAEQQGETARARTLAELGAWLCAQDPWFLGGPIQDVGLYCPRPRHEPDGSDADRYTLVVVPQRQGQGAVPAGWTRIGPPAADLAVYAPPQRDPLPCPGGSPAPGSPYLSAGPVQAQLVGCPSPPPTP